MNVSKTCYGVGFAYSTSHSTKIFKLPPEASPQRVPRPSIFALCQDNDGQQYPHHRSDSLSAHMSIKSPNLSKEIFQHIRNIISSIRDKNVELMCIPSREFQLATKKSTY